MYIYPTHRLTIGKDGSIVSFKETAHKTLDAYLICFLLYKVNDYDREVKSMQ